MKKLFVAVAVVAVPIFIATGAWALTVNDQEGVPGAYYGGTYTYAGSGSQDPSYAHDINPGPSDPDGSIIWSITGFTATQVATKDGPSINVVFSGDYFGSSLVKPVDTGNPTVVGKPGDLYISSTGWRVSTPSADGHATADKFNMSTEGWNYVLRYGQSLKYDYQNNLKWYYNATLYTLTSGYTPTSSQGYFNEFRADQAWRGGYGDVVTTNGTAILDMNTQTLTFSFLNVLGWNPDQLGYHWAMGCGNDVVEGGGTPVPEPGSLLLLGLGLAGLGVYRRKAARG